MLHATMDRCGRSGEVAAATLLHAVSGAAGPRYRLDSADGGWIVEGPEETLGFRGGTRHGELTIDVRRDMSVDGIERYLRKRSA